MTSPCVCFIFVGAVRSDVVCFSEFSILALQMFLDFFLIQVLWGTWFCYWIFHFRDRVVKDWFEILTNFLRKLAEGDSAMPSGGGTTKYQDLRRVPVDGDDDLSDPDLCDYESERDCKLFSVKKAPIIKHSMSAIRWSTDWSSDWWIDWLID